MKSVDLQMLVDSIPQLAWSARADGFIDYYNKPWFDYTGTTPEAMVGWGWQSVHHPDELPRVLEAWKTSLATGTPFEMSFPLRRVDGTFRWFLTRVTPIHDATGTLIRWFGTSTDVHAQRNTEHALARSGAQAAMAADIAAAWAGGGGIDDSMRRCCQAVVEHLGVAFARVWTLDQAGVVLELRASAGQYTHIDGGHARVPIGKFKIGRVAAEKRPHISNDVANDPWIGDPAWAKREGYVSFAGFPLLIGEQVIGVFAMFSRQPLSQGELDALSSSSRVIAVGIERKQSELDVQESEARYRFMADLLPAQVWTATPDGQLDYVNQQALDYFASAFEDTIGTGWVRFLHPDDVPACVEKWTKCLASGDAYEHEFRLRHYNGEFRWHMARALPFWNDRGELEKWFGTNTDVEDSKRSQREHEALIFALAQSNSDLDQFASVASHDLKAPLRGIATVTEWIEDDLRDDQHADTKERLRLLRDRVTRMSALIDGVLDYSRIGRKHYAPADVDVKELLNGVVELLAPPPPMQIVVPSELPTLRSERVPLQQIFMNLISNAMKYAGRADARVEVVCTDAGGFYDFAICDNGPGIDARDHERVWGMFKTLKAPDIAEGTGIGLAVVKKLVTVRGGRVWIESSLGSGARFHFTWPKQHAPSVG